MSMTKKQRFGLIAFIILIIAAYLVTTEPWLRSNREMQSAIGPAAPPANIYIRWSNLESGYPDAYTCDTILAYSGFHLAYNEQFEQAAWVAYVLTREEIET